MCNSIYTITMAEIAYTYPAGCFLAAKTFCQHDPQKKPSYPIGKRLTRTCFNRCMARVRSIRLNVAAQTRCGPSTSASRCPRSFATIFFGPPKLKRRIGETLNGLPKEPKEMHCSTYDRLDAPRSLPSRALAKTRAGSSSLSAHGLYGGLSGRPRYLCGKM
jgi:hypothetical protein